MPPQVDFVLAIPCRGRSHLLPQILRTLSATRSAHTAIVVVSSGPKRFPDPRLPGVFVVHLGDVPTLAAAVNFAWYAVAAPGCILAKIDNDVLPPDGWEDEVRRCCEVAWLGGFLSGNEPLTPPISVRGRALRQAHLSPTWGVPFIYGRFTWLAPPLAECLGYHDERFVRNTDGDLGERASRVPGAFAAYSADHLCTHMLPRGLLSTEPEEMVRRMYEASNRLIAQLPVRAAAQPTIWEDCLTREAAAELVRSCGTLELDIERFARERLLHKLASTYAAVEAADVVKWLFDSPASDRQQGTSSPR
jgi:hypothetical protein